MEAVAANALLIELLRKRVVVREFRVPAMEGGIEAGDLRQLRLSLPQRADRAEVVGLVEWSQRREGLKPLERDIVDQNWLAVIRPAMNHAMADRSRQGSDLGAKELDDLAQGCGHIRRVSSGPGFVDKSFALHGLGREVGMDANALDLPLEPAPQLIASADQEELELDARAAGVDDEDGL
jgi:hypothetical protein